MQKFYLFIAFKISSITSRPPLVIRMNLRWKFSHRKLSRTKLSFHTLAPLHFLPSSDAAVVSKDDEEEKEERKRGKKRHKEGKSL